MGDGGKQRKASENSGRRRGTAGDDAVRPGPWLLLVGQVQEKTGRDDEMSSVLVLAQDGRTAPLRTLVVKPLLEREEVNPESQDNSGRTPLSHASSGYGCGEALKLLLDCEGFGLESRDNSGRIPRSSGGRCFDSAIQTWSILN